MQIERTVIEIVIFGRGGQGGVTLAKLVAGMHFIQGRHVQAFGSYGAERSGAPVKAFVRIDEKEITSRNQIYEPDHVIVLDPALVADSVATGLIAGGWIVLNSPSPPGRFTDQFAGYRLAAVDATRLALANALGSRTTPIVNTTMLGAIARVFDLGIENVEKALSELGFGGANVTAARQAFDTVLLGEPPRKPANVGAPIRPRASGVSILARAGDPPSIKTGVWAKQHPERRELDSPCNHGCPAGNDVRGFLSAVQRGDYGLALSILYETSPLPGVCGRVCPAPCMDGCHRSTLDGSVNVRELERFVADHATPPAPEPQPRGASVAVVGSGPAGLSACYHLARRGYAVTLFEQGAELGGLLRSGIPAFRLPTEVVDREIAHILAHGVTAKTRARLERADLALLAREHAAVFVATGLTQMRDLGLGSIVSPRIEQGIDFLDRTRPGPMALAGEDVIVVGGGNTATDAARSALRLGARTVRIVYRRSRAEMPAIREEIDEALEEGVVLSELVQPTGLKDTGAELVLLCTRMRLGEPDESERRRPVADTSPASSFELRCSRVILALGASGDLTILPESTTDKPVLVGGDLATNEGTVAAAIASGRRAASRIHAMLGSNVTPARAEPLPVPADRIRLTYYERAAQQRAEVRAAGVRARDFSEIRAGLSPDEAALEAGRCFTCGSCTHCDICRANCPEGVLSRQGNDYFFDYDDCKGCGICALECPRGVLVMRQP